MFSKAKPKAVPPFNSRHKFVDQNMNKDLCNQSFDTAQQFFHRKSQLRQTKLCLEPSGSSDCNGPIKRLRYETPPKNEFVILPTPKKNKKDQLNNTFSGATAMTKVIQQQLAAPKEQPSDEVCNRTTTTGAERNALCLVGRVDFCLKMHKLAADVDALWDIYGQLIKITCGKQRFEHVLVLSNGNVGPLLQCSYYDFGDVISQLRIGYFVRVVGRFTAQGNHLTTFKVFKVEEVNANVLQQNFTRIQNVTSFVLLQKSVQKKANAR